MSEIELPPEFRKAQQTLELLRAWDVDGDMVTLTPTEGIQALLGLDDGEYPESVTWGVVLAHVARNLASTIAESTGANEEEALSEIVATLVQECCPDDDDEDGHLVIVRVPGSFQVQERSERFEEPLNAALDDAGLGHTSGGGTELGLVGDKPGIVAVEIECVVAELEPGVALVRQWLTDNDAPEGTTLRYEDEDDDYVCIDARTGEESDV